MNHRKSAFAAVRRVVTACLLLCACSCPAQAQPAGPVQSPFDKDDPEIQAIRELKWKGVDFENLDPRTRCLSYLALSKGLASIGGKADARLDLLVDFIDAHSLGEALAKSKEAIPEPPAVTFEDMRKAGAAFVQSPGGKQKMMGELTSIPDDGLAPYLKLHERTARRAFEQALESRHQVRVIGLFLEKQGKLGEFKSWSAEEKKRRMEERQAQAAQQRADATEAERQRRELALAAAEEKKRREAELAAQRMELLVQEQAMAQQGVGPAQQSGWGDDDDDYWGYPYYYTNAYRGYVRDRVEDAWGRWQENRPPRPTPRSRPARRR